MGYAELLNKFKNTFVGCCDLHKIVIANELYEICDTECDYYEDVAKLIDELVIKSGLDASCFKDLFEDLIEQGETFYDILTYDKQYLIDGAFNYR